MIGLGSMIGAGIFAAFAPAAMVAGPFLLAGLALIAVVAACNATSSAQLAAQSAGLLFFAFAGYARIATMGEEVKDPAMDPIRPRARPPSNEKYLDNSQLRGYCSHVGACVLRLPRDSTFHVALVRRTHEVLTDASPALPTSRDPSCLLGHSP